MSKRISIGSWAYTIGSYAAHPVDFDTVCKKLVDFGFDGVELGGFKPHPNPDDLKTRSERQDVASKVRGMGLEFSGLAANLWHTKLVNTDDNKPYLDEFRKNCQFCVDMGINTIRVDTVQPPTILKEIDTDTAMLRLVKTWRDCVIIAADHGLRITWEFEPGFVFNKPSEILRIVEAIDSPIFGILYDTCHGQMVGVNGSRQPGQKEVLAGGQVEFVGMLKHKINHIHLIDSDNKCHKDKNGEDETSTHMPFGDGVVDFDTLVPVIENQTDVPHDWWTIDLCFWPEAWEATERCKKSIDVLKAKYGNLKGKTTAQPAVALAR
jgi:sugar phosphate isomerase/epimerase